MGRAPCCSKIGLNRGPWSIEEDKLLIHYIQTHGEGHWRSLPSKAGLLRCGKSCRLRWVNYLRPGVKRGNFTSDENDTIIRLHSLHGNRWSLIAAEFPGRTDNEIKNHWNTHLRKKALVNVQNDIDNIANPSPTSTKLHNTLVSKSLTEPSLASTKVTTYLPSTPSNEEDQQINITNNVIDYDNQSLTEPVVKSTKVTTFLLSTPSSEADQHIDITNDDIDYKNGSKKKIMVEPKIVVNISATPTSSGTSYSSSVITDGEVNMSMDMNTNTDTFFYELDDFIDVDQKIKGYDYVVSSDDGTKQLERVYTEYLQLLNYGAE